MHKPCPPNFHDGGKLVIIAVMGFPTWTLWGMGIAAVGALAAILLAYLMQSPRFVARTGLSTRQLQMQQRVLTGMALALQLLTIGFFFAGVPLGGQETAVLPTPELTATNTPETAGEIVALSNENLTATAVAQTSPTPTSTRSLSGTPATGAFGGLPTATTEATAGTEDAIFETPAPETAVPTNTLSAQPTNATLTPTPTQTPTSTPTPTQSPTPTLTPTPVEGETAVANTGGGNLAVQRVPGGSIVALVPNGGIVILQPGHANYAGNLWREIRTVNGILGWVPEAQLLFDPNQEN